MKLKLMIVLATVPIWVGLGGAAAYAQMGGSNNVDGFYQRGPFAEMRDRWIDALDLTPEQQAEIRAIREQAWAENEDLVQQLTDERTTMRSLMAGTGRADQIRQQHDQIQQLQQQLGDEMLETRLAIREVLTEEQRAELNEMLPEFPREGGRFQRGRYGRGLRN